MTYDRDLHRHRRLVLGLGAGNLTAAIMNALDHNWLVAISALIWTGCCAAWLRMIHFQQITRDAGRVIEAGLHSMRREIESGEIG